MRILPNKKTNNPKHDAEARVEPISIKEDDAFMRSELRNAGFFIPANEPRTGWLFVNTDQSVGTRPITWQRDYVQFFDRDKFLRAAKRLCKNG